MFTDDELKAIEGVFRDVLKSYGLRPVPHGSAGRVRRYRSRLRSAKGCHTEQQWLARIEFWGWSCRYCWKELTPQTVVKEHSIPLSRGGTNWTANLSPTCAACNAAKKDKTPNEFGSHWRVMR